MRKARVASSGGCSFDFINKLGVKALLSIMKDKGYDYNTELFSITSEIQKRYDRNQRERYSIDYLFEVKAILKHIEEENLLEKE